MSGASSAHAGEQDQKARSRVRSWGRLTGRFSARELLTGATFSRATAWCPEQEQGDSSEEDDERRQHGRSSRRSNLRSGDFADGLVLANDTWFRKSDGSIQGLRYQSGVQHSLEIALLPCVVGGGRRSALMSPGRSAEGAGRVQYEHRMPRLSITLALTSILTYRHLMRWLDVRATLP